MSVFWKAVLWLSIASLVHTILEAMQTALPADLKWLSLNHLAFAFVFNIGALAGKHYDGWWFLGSALSTLPPAKEEKKSR